MDTRFYLKALGITGLFVLLLLLLWASSDAPANEAQVRNAIGTRTAIALTSAPLLGPFPTRTSSSFDLPTFVPETSIAGPAPTRAVTASPTNTALFPRINTPAPAAAPSLTPSPVQTIIAQAPATNRAPSSHQPTRAPRLFPPVPVTGIQDPSEFARWYFARVWQERDYQNLWDNYLTPSYKTNVGSGIFEDYAGWWNTVERVDVNSVDVLENNGTIAWVRVNLTFRMQDGRVLSNEVYDYVFLYDPSRGTWMFDFNN